MKKSKTRYRKFASQEAIQEISSSKVAFTVVKVKVTAPSQGNVKTAVKRQSVMWKLWYKTQQATMSSLGRPMLILGKVKSLEGKVSKFIYS